MILQAIRGWGQKLITLMFGSQLRRNMVSGVGLTVVNVAVMLVSFRVYLHYLGYEKYGVWLVLGVVLSFVQMGGNLGIEPAVTKLVAEEYGRKNVSGIQSYVMMALLILCFSGSVGLAIILCLKSQIIAAFKLSSDNARLASWLLPYVGFLCIYVFIVRALNATLSGLGRMDLANFNQTIGRVVVVVVAVVLLHQGRGVESLLIGSVASYIVINAASIVFIRRIVSFRLIQPSNWDIQRLKKLLHFGSGIVGASFLNMLLSPFNKLMLSRYVGVDSIPIYEIAFTGSFQVRGLIEAGLRALMPEISRIGVGMNGRAKDRINGIYKRAMKLVLVCGVPTFLSGMLIIYYTPILKLWLGEKFVPELPSIFCIMLLGTVVSLLSVPAYFTLMGLGHIRHVVGSHAILAGLNVVLILALILFSSSLTVASVAWVLAIATVGSVTYLLWRQHIIMLQLRS